VVIDVHNRFVIMFRNEMGSKTPVSILQEMCIRKGNPPQYELIHDGGGSHEALFKYKVFVGETTGTYM
jgi:dsRNA-specific ribonuclease